MKDEQAEGFDLFGKAVLNPKRTMSDFFGVPPFSVIDTTDSKWQARKRKWTTFINDLGQARPNVLSGGSGENNMLNKINAGTSILDACLEEVIVKWFTMENFKSFLTRLQAIPFLVLLVVILIDHSRE